MTDARNLSTPILIVGADSDLGSTLMRELSRRGHKPMGTSRRPASRHLFLDLQRPRLSDLNLEKPGKVVLAAGITNISYCSRNPLKAYSVNVTGTKVLVEQLVELGWQVLFLSTADVFSNQRQPITLDTQPNPTSTYGRQKREVESFMASHEGSCGVVRITKVIGPHTQPLLRWMQELKDQKMIEAVDERLIAPLSLSRASSELCDILLGNIQGVWHLGGGHIFSYPQIARYLAGCIGHEGKVTENPSNSDGPEWVVFDQSTQSIRCRIVYEPLYEILADLLKSNTNS